MIPGAAASGYVEDLAFVQKGICGSYRNAFPEKYPI